MKKVIYGNQCIIFNIVPPKIVNVPENINYSCSRQNVCLVPRRLSFEENVRAKEGGKETTFRLYPSHGPLRFITSHSFRARLCHAKNEAPEEEADKMLCIKKCNPIFRGMRDISKNRLHCKRKLIIILLEILKDKMINREIKS